MIDTIPENPENAQSWVEFAKRQKDHAVKNTDRGDIPPTVIVERNGKVQAIVIAPQIDKRLGLQAAAMCQAGYDPDAITMVLDAHIGTMSSGKRPDGEKMTEEEIEAATAEWRKKYPKGMQHACDNEDACATGDITDCLICHRINREGKITMVTLPYAYHGKDGPAFKWLDQDAKYKDMVGESPIELTGLIPDALREIMSHGNIIDQVPTIKELSNHFKDFSEERIRFYIARAIIGLLASRHFAILDFLSGTHPEWTGAKDVANELLTKLVREGFFPREAEAPIREIINDHIGTLPFREKLTTLLKTYGYWLPADERSDIGRFVFEFETFCMSPSIPKNGDEDDSPQTAADAAEGKRVRVWNGDRSEYLGEGNLVGNVKVYAIQMPDGSLQSSSNAEIEPDPSEVPEGGVVRSVGNNPKIVLDNGQTVYGCQVWWEPAEGAAPKGSAGASAASPHQHGKHKHNPA